MLNDLSKFVEYLKSHRHYFGDSPGRSYVKDRDFYCYKCKENRRHIIWKVYSKVDFKLKTHMELPLLPHSGIHASSSVESKPEDTLSEETLCPSIFGLECLQCDSGITIVICKFNGKPSIFNFPSTIADAGTDNTHLEVGFYLDQAYKCEIIGALTAAVTMYRAALETFLHFNGYKNGMLDAKIKSLEQEILSGRAPSWALNLDPEILSIIKLLGNYSIHPSDFDIEKQKTFTKQLIEGIKTFFNELLDICYEKQLRDQKRKELLEQAKDELDKLKE